MQTLVLATHNAHKVAELQLMLQPCLAGNYTLISMDEAGFTGEIDENGSTFEENARIKALTVARATGLTALADDSGLSVDALGGLPGVRSARYAGETASDAENLQKLLDALRDTPDDKRTARFVSVFCACTPAGETVSARGVCEGIILRDRRGSGDFGYDPIFYYPPFQKTFAELTPEEKNAVSHRGRAVECFIPLFFGERKS